MSDPLRRRLLDATLPHVPFDGWSERTLRAGAESADVKWPAVRRAFPGGEGDMLGFWNAEGDRVKPDVGESRQCGDPLSLDDGVPLLHEPQCIAVESERPLHIADDKAGVVHPLHSHDRLSLIDLPIESRPAPY